MKKRYRLIKDVVTPAYTIPYGTIFKSDGHDGYYSEGSTLPNFYPALVVEGSPEWFEPIEERDPYLRAVAMVCGTNGNPKAKADALKQEFLVVPRNDDKNSILNTIRINLLF